ncbi:MAG: glycosyltransferase [Parcubacteria group bacterium]|jgi:glycosyltransferase involved in cell wall biosynthesis
MKLLLIKFGKAVSAIRRDGLLVGGRRIFDYTGNFFRAMFGVGSGDVLIISSGVGDSAHYRAYSHAEELNIHGIAASTTIQDNPRLLAYADQFKIFIFQRTISTPALSKLIGKIKDQGKVIIFETDDLVFDPKYIQTTEMYQQEMTDFEKKQYEKGVGEEILNDPYVKVCTTSTGYLAKILEGYGKQVFVVKNKLMEWEVEEANRLLKELPVPTDDAIKIGYFSGTASHNRDFATITDALVEVMKNYPLTKLLLAGSLETESKLNELKDRIIRLSLVTRKKYYQNVSLADIAIAPLTPGDPFCEAKSELKFFEAGILKVPTVAVDNQTFREAIADGVDGFLAKDTAEWVEKLEKLITDADLRKSMGEKARTKTLAEYTTRDSHNEEYYNYLRSRL